MASSDAVPIPIKNQAYRVTFPILDGDGDLVPGATGLDSEVSKDGGTFADVTAESAEIATASGMYYLDLTATEMNADTVSLIVKTTTSGAKTTPIVLYPAESTDIPVNVTAIGGVVQSATDFKDMVDTGYDPGNHKIQSDLIYIHGTALTETNGQLAAAFKKLFDVATPLLVASDVMVGTDSAALASTALSDTTWTDARAGYIDELAAANLPTDVANVKTDTAAILEDTDDIGVAGAGLTDLGGMSTAMKAAVQAEANDALVAQRLDHLMAVGVSVDWATTVNLDSVIGHMVDVGTVATFDRTSDSLEAIRNKQTDIEEDTGALETRLTSTRSGYLDNLSAGAVALDAGVDITKIHGVAITETVNGRLAAAFTKLFDVAAPLLVASEVMRGTDGANTVVPDAEGVAATPGEVATALTNLNLDHLMKIAVDTNWAATVHLDSVIGHLADVGTAPTFDRTMDSQEAIRDKQTDIESDTHELQTDWADGGRLDLLLDACNTVEPDPSGTAAGLHTTTDGKVDAVQTDATAIKGKTDNLPSGMAKNVAVPKYDIYMVLSLDHLTGATGKTVTGTISKDGGTFAALTNSIAEVSGGLYTMASGLTQAERNADVSTLVFTADDCDDLVITIISS